MTVLAAAVKQNKPLRIATELAARSRCANRHGAVVVSRGQVVASAVNVRRREVTDTSWRDSHVHAEVAAIRAAGSRAAGSTVYVARVSASGDPAYSAPCVRCQGALRRAGVRRVVYTAPLPVGFDVPVPTDRVGAPVSASKASVSLAA